MLEIDKVLSVMLPEAIRVPIHYYTQRYSGRCDPMIGRLPGIVPRPGRSIDVGANQGIYTFALSRLSTCVETFEPQPSCARRLTAFASVFGKNVTVHRIGLSDHAATLKMKIPTVNGKLGSVALTGRASVELDFPSYQSLEIPVRTLDSFNFDSVTFLKIDVEGHEQKVIEGARETLLRCRPILLVEIEQRHLGTRPIDSGFRQIVELGYRGTFFYKGSELPLSAFDGALHQNLTSSNVEEDALKERYVNNFLFRPTA